MEFVNPRVGTPTRNPERGRSPFVVQIVNTAKEKSIAKVFGAYKYASYATENFGNPKEIQLLNLYSSDKHGYAQLLNQIMHNPFIVETIRFQSSSSPQMSALYSWIQSDANGFTAIQRESIAKWFNAFQYQSTIVDGKFEREHAPTFNGGTELEIEMEPESTLVISIYPMQTNDSSLSLSGVQSGLSQPVQQVKRKEQKWEKQRASFKNAISKLFGRFKKKKAAKKPNNDEGTRMSFASSLDNSSQMNFASSLDNSSQFFN